MENLTWNNLVEKDGRNMDISKMTEKERKEIGNWIFREAAESLGFQKKQERGKISVPPDTSQKKDPE